MSILTTLADAALVAAALALYGWVMSRRPWSWREPPRMKTPRR